MHRKEEPHKLTNTTLLTNTAFAQKLPKHLSSMNTAGLKVHVSESYAEINMLKDKLLEIENDKRLLKDLLSEANKKIISKTRQGQVYSSNKRDVTFATPSQTQAHNFAYSDDFERQKSRHSVRSTVA